MTETTKEDGRATDLDSVMRRLKKLLALAMDPAATKGEAENAMRMAQNLMAKHGLEEGHVYRAELTTFGVRSTAADLPPPWEGFLMSQVCRAFGARNLWAKGVGEKGARGKGAHVIIVPKHRRELVEYAFDVLRRGIVKQRAEFIATLPSYWTRQQKTDNGDAFGVAYVEKLKSKISDFAVDPREKTALDKYVEDVTKKKKAEKNYRSLDRAAGVAWAAGAEAGEKASLHRPMSGAAELKRIGG